MLLTCDLFTDGKKALLELSRIDLFFHLFWLLGPLFLLIERTPGDVYISIIALAFVIKSLKTRDAEWLKFLWVKLVFVFWGICILSASMSPNSSYSLGEAFIWIRFPLFAMASAFWLARDRRLLKLMLISTAFGLLLMCGILLAEIATEGVKSRLSWPYNDMVSGNYLAKVGLPVIVFSTALFLSERGLKSLLVGGFCLLVISATMMTGERVNFLILICAASLTIFYWEPRWKKRLLFVILGSLVPISIFAIFPYFFSRFIIVFIAELPFNADSDYYKAMAPAWAIFEMFPILGIGPGNFRYECHELTAFLKSDYTCHNHPHNFYLQILSETGLLGLVSSTAFIGSIILQCLRAGCGQKQVLKTTAWIIPFALFWPIKANADFFGQWNNIFLWSAVALALSVAHLKPRKLLT